jgi:uncharacterized SAM-binding protein YcdF (DUF218 family)
MTAFDEPAGEAMTATGQIPRSSIPYGLFAIPPVILALCVLGVIQIGYWLVVEDPLQPARAVVVLGGQVPFRAIEAARIYQQGLAPEVWLTRGASSAELAFNRLGVAYVREETYSRRVLERAGVPSSSICLLEQPTRNTAEELLVVARELQRVGGNRVILVTSKPHSRRVKVTWRVLVGDVPRAEVRWTADDPYNPSHWWQNTEDSLAVSREFLGLLNAWAGFPVRPDRQ